MILHRHFQFSDSLGRKAWLVELHADGGPRGFSIEEKRNGKKTIIGYGLSFPEAYKRFRERCLAMGREAGKEWALPEIRRN